MFRITQPHTEELEDDSALRICLANLLTRHRYLKSSAPLAVTVQVDEDIAFFRGGGVTQDLRDWAVDHKVRVRIEAVQVGNDTPVAFGYPRDEAELIITLEAMPAPAYVSSGAGHADDEDEEDESPEEQ